MDIRHKIYPTFRYNDFDVAIAELEHVLFSSFSHVFVCLFRLVIQDIEGNAMSFVCLPKAVDSDDGGFDSKAFFFGGGLVENGEI